MARNKWLSWSAHSKLWLCLFTLLSFTHNETIQINVEYRKNNLESGRDHKNAETSQDQQRNSGQLSTRELSNARKLAMGIIPKSKDKKKHRLLDLEFNAFQIYKDFYTGVAHVNTDGDARQVYNKELLQETETYNKINEKMKHDFMNQVPDQIYLMDRLWFAVRKGRLPPQEIPDKHPAWMNYYKEIVMEQLTGGSIVEIGDGVTALHLAVSVNDTVMAVVLNDAALNYITEKAKSEGLENFYVGHVTADDLPGCLEEMYADHRVLFSNLLLTNLTSLIGTLLPHEFEELLARVFALSYQTLILNPKSSEKQKLSYFMDNWENMEILLHRVCQVASLVCQINLVTGRGSWNGQNDESLYKVSIVRGVRNLPDTLCDMIRPDTQCAFVYNRKTDNISIRFSDGKTFDAPVMPEGISLSTILKFGCTASCRGQIFLQSLLLPYSEDITMYSLVAYMGHVIIYENENDEVELDIENVAATLHQTIRKITGSSISEVQAAENKRIYQKNTEAEKAPHIVQEQEVKSDKLIHDQTKDSAVNTDKLSPAHSQVDGVAQRWERVNGEVPTGSEHDQDQIRHMSQHWDRENIEGIAGGDPLQVQAQQDLDKLEKAWNREKQIGEKDFEESLENKNKVKKSVPYQEHINNDAMLRGDEKDLKQAMGFLHGNSDVREIKNIRIGQKIVKRKKLLKMKQNKDSNILKVNTRNDKVVDDSHYNSTKILTPKSQINKIEYADAQVLKNPIPTKIIPGQQSKQDKGLLPLAQYNSHGTPPKVMEKGVESNERKKQQRNYLKFNVKHGKIIAKKIESSNDKKNLLLERLHNPQQIGDLKEGRLHFQPSHNIKDHNVVVKTGDEVPFTKIQMIEEFAPDEENNDDYDYGKTEDLLDVESKGIPNLVNQMRQPYSYNKKNTFGMDGEGKAKMKFDTIANDQISHLNQNNVEEDPDGINYEDDNEKENYDDYQQYRERDFNNKLPFGKKNVNGYNSKWRGMRRLMMEHTLELPITDKGKAKDIASKYVSLNSVPQEEKHKLKVLLEEIHNQRIKVDTRSKLNSLQGHSEIQDTSIKSPINSQPKFITVVDKKEIAKAIAGVEEDGYDFDNDDDHDEEEDDPQPKLQLGMQATSFGPLDQEQRLYDHQWQQLKVEFEEDLTTSQQQQFSLLLYGGQRHVLLGLKLSRRYPNSNIVSCMPSTGQHVVMKYRQLLQSMGVKNVILLFSPVTVNVINSLFHQPHMTRYQILGLQFYEPLIQLGTGFIIHLGRALTLAKTTFLEVPDPRQVILLQHILNKKIFKGEISFFKGIVHESLHLVNAEVREIQLLDDTLIPTTKKGHDTPIKILRIDLHSLQRKVDLGCDNHDGLLTLKPDSSIVVVPSQSSQQYKLSGMHTFNLQALIKLGVLAEHQERRHLFGNYLELALYSDMCPAHIAWTNMSLIYQPFSYPSVPANTNKNHQCQVVVKMIANEISDEWFSFLDHNGFKGLVITALARKYKNATFVAMVHNDASAAQQLYQQLKQDKLHNMVVTNLTLDNRFTAKLLDSPEFYRYQYIDAHQLINMIQSARSRSEFNKMLGQAIACSVTTFVQLPSSQMLSLAMSTYFPEGYHGFPQNDWTKTLLYTLSEHPTELYDNAEFKIISQAAEANVNITVKGEVLPQPESHTTWQYGWSLLRIDVVNLTVMVNHHFDYQLDGHGRKYTLRCVTTNKTHYEVYLVRKHDGFRIPYGNVHAVTLIALLRMGLLNDIKSEFYDKFIHLPLYEDMAPWNIVFRGGNLEYIDYDTKDSNLSKVVPAAFQIMFMLLNYERTVKDFGKCHGDTNILYGLNLVGKCVDGVFHGPCEDTRYPVPCGDHTCRTTYIECLQALHELEVTKANRHEQVMMDLKSGQPIKEGHDNVLNYERGTWSFNKEGAKPQGHT